MNITTHAPPSPSSSVASLALSDDASDASFSDSDWLDIVSSSGSTRSREDDGPFATDRDDDDEPRDKDWLGVVDPVRGPLDDLLRGPLDSDSEGVQTPSEPEDETLEDTPANIAEKDAQVMDALSESLERVASSPLSTSIPMTASNPLLHFSTSPKAVRRSSSSASQSNFDLSDSASTIQLAFPDPLSPSREHLPRNIELLGAAEPPTPVEEVQEILSKVSEWTDSSSPSSSTSSYVLPSTTLPDVEAAAPGPVSDEPHQEEEDVETEAEYYVEAPDVLVIQEYEFKEIKPSDSAVSYDSQKYLRFISSFLSAHTGGHRWTASVIVSILALLIGSATFVSTFSSAPLTAQGKHTPVLLTPTITTPSFWGLIGNRTLPIPPSPSPSTIMGSSFKNMAVSVFTPWSIDVQRGECSTRSLSGIPRRLRRDGLREFIHSPRRCVSGYRTAAPSPVSPMSGWFKMDIIPSLDAVSIDPPSTTHHRHKSHPKAPVNAHDTRPQSTSLDVLASTALQVQRTIGASLSTLSRTLRAQISDELALLIQALDELLRVIHAQTMLLTSTSFKEVLEKGAEGVKTRHDRAKKNAKALRTRGEAIFEGFKDSVGRARENARKVKTKAGGILSNDGVGAFKEGFRQRLRVKKRSVEERERGFVRKMRWERSVWEGRGRPFTPPRGQDTRATRSRSTFQAMRGP